MRNGKIVSAVTLTDGQVMKEVDENGYQCLSVIEVDKIKEQETTENAQANIR